MMDNREVTSYRAEPSWVLATAEFLGELLGTTLLCMVFVVLETALEHLSLCFAHSGFDPVFETGVRVVSGAALFAGAAVSLVLVLTGAARYVGKLCAGGE